MVFHRLKQNLINPKKKFGSYIYHQINTSYQSIHIEMRVLYYSKLVSKLELSRNPSSQSKDPVSTFSEGLPVHFPPSRVRELGSALIRFFAFKSRLAVLTSSSALFQYFKCFVLSFVLKFRTLTLSILWTLSRRRVKHVHFQQHSCPLASPLVVHVIPEGPPVNPLQEREIKYEDKI